MGFSRLSELEDINWEVLQNVIRAMVRKYDAEENHEQFEQSVTMAQTMWRMDNS
jgi:hypothetical protein